MTAFSRLRALFGSPTPAPRPLEIETGLQSALDDIRNAATAPPMQHTTLCGDCEHIAFTVCTLTIGGQKFSKLCFECTTDRYGKLIGIAMAHGWKPGGGVPLSKWLDRELRRRS